ncbi:histidine phosphatase family protein [Sulfurospirillum diekertiae]|uniref:Histidine phosphatase family protein n=1 Tax=Sulfurospirillum diekertiae TaxID=1854492 RepID=A0A6G9VR44_9BACT|nr:histidine phosphatase family protein [Sulfurospirillum diekertiae]QIR74830.1 histidine phosphatase family protein [Sulfurospirillum diekertiae]QIR77494.1 histidine phosphatase family protein [Sulfurospirillum diekertiae]
MKKIYLIRHAKSSWKDETIDDFERPLNSRGKRDVAFMGKRLKLFDVKPDIIYTSPAKRAEKTAKELVKEMNYDKKKIKLIDTLFESSYEQYMELIHATDDHYSSIFIIAHNPTITEVGERLSGAILSNIPTCAIVCISFEVESFKEITEESGHILFFDYPKKHLKD